MTLAGGVIFAACMLGIITRPAGLLAMIWPANALTLGMLLRTPGERRFAILLAAIPAYLIADLVTGSDLVRAILLNSANLFGVVAAFTVAQFIPANELKLKQPQSVLWYVLIAAVGAFVAGGFAALLEPGSTRIEKFGVVRFWFASELLNYMALLPFVMSMPPWRRLVAYRPAHPSVVKWQTVLPVVALISACAMATYAKGPGAIAFVVPALIWCGLAYSVFFVSMLAVVFAYWSSIVIGAQYLPALSASHDGSAIVSLRLAAFMIALAPITLSILMRNREEISQKLSIARQRVDMALGAGRVVGIWELNVAADTMKVEALDRGSDALTREWGIERALANIHPDDRERVRDKLRSAVQTGADCHCKYRDVALPSMRWLAVAGKPVFDQRNAVSHLVGVFIDLTEQTKTEEALALSDRRFDIIVEAIPDIVWSADAAGRHDYYNRRWHEFTGVQPGTIVSDTWKDLIHPDDQSRVVESWAACLQSGASFAIDYRFLHNDGQYRWLKAQAKPLRDTQGVIVRWYGTATDIDDVKQREAEREAVARELDHRMGNLFALVSSLVNLSVREGGSVPVVAEAIRGRLRALHKAHRLIVLDQAGGASSMIALLQMVLRPYDDGGGRITVSGDDAQIAAAKVTLLALLFHELATNAVKYGALRDCGGDLSITVGHSDDHLTIEWKEQSALPPPSSDGTGFGSKLFTSVLQGQLRGEFTRALSAEGLLIVMRLPLSSLA